MADENQTPVTATGTPANQAETQPEGGQSKVESILTADDSGSKAPANEAPKAVPPAPEAYELKAPEGYPISEDGLKDLNALCKGAKLTREQGEAVLKYMHSNYAAWQDSQVAQVAKWAEEARADKDFGGDKFDANVADAKRGLATFDTDGSIRAMLEETGYGSHPAVLKIFARVGKALGEDSLHHSTGGASEKPLAERFYGNNK